MATETREEPAALTPAQCAAQIQVHPDTIERWIREGHLRAFCRPGSKPGQRRGAKCYRVWASDWADFCRHQTVTAAPAPPAPAAPIPFRVAGAPCGTDGISRLRRGGAAG